MTTKPSFRAEFNASEGGKAAVSKARWVNTRGENGPWSEITTATVAVQAISWRVQARGRIRWTRTRTNCMAKQPLAEVFGFPIDNHSPEAKRCRDNALCPFGNKVPNCTKDKANNPLGVCSILDGNDVIITCPVRFREKWIIAEDAAAARAA